MSRHDVVIVGSRCAGATAAAVFARAGRDVVVLDRATFPSDTLSTHVLFGGGIDVLKDIGAYEKIAAQDPSYARELDLTFDGEVHIREPWNAADGGTSNYVWCIPRPMQDAALVETAREHGADVREGWEVLDVLWRAGRVVGVVAKDPDGEVHELRAKLVVGADGRRSTIAARVGAWKPYRASKNGRGLVFRYLDDPRAGTPDAERLHQWRDGTSFCMTFPSAPRPRMIALCMGPAADVARARKDPEGTWQEFLRRHPGWAARIEGATNLSKLRSTGDVPAFFRPSSGPGWALAGDAGHFKDPVIGQGQRDAMWMGHRLATMAADVLDDPGTLDVTLRRYEQERDEECLSAYHFANGETRIQRQSPVLIALARDLGRREMPSPDLSDVFQRVRDQQDVLPLGRLARGLRLAVAHDLRHRPGALPATLRSAAADLAVDVRVRAEIRARRFRSTRLVEGSEHPGVAWPDAPRRPEVAARPAAAVRAAMPEPAVAACDGTASAEREAVVA
ncbi:NAD(P)/FAD-dependent oxidoreductase [Conexibacter sp. SYSU D00693]|uniref:NAD(P)/FAD-dependent oxidoreductase n=1 Tax=Conexibacter sp. SYSU D00693 TaxID=2812560 RepID=UPI00196A2743|nr:FAD-dependent monooxygenase [Conexibacter sp. SYSU D00693]